MKNLPHKIDVFVLNKKYVILTCFFVWGKQLENSFKEILKC